MDCSNSFFKPDKIDLAFVVFILFIMLCNVTFCAEPEDVTFENVTFENVYGIVVSPNYNYFSSSNPSHAVYYFRTEPGYIYHFSFGGERYLASFDGIPELNKPYNYIGTFLPGSSFSYLSSNTTTICLGFSNYGSNVTVTRERVTNMGGVVNILSNDVGTNQFWNIFTLAIPFILIVVIVVFGFFIIRRLTKKESKGDIRF